MTKREALEVLLSRVRKRFTKTKENVCEDDKARRGKGTSSKTTLLTSSFTSSKTILPLLLLCFSSFFFPLCVRRKEEDEVRESHTYVMSVGLLLRERTTRCSVTFSLSLSRVRDERTMRTPLPIIPFIITKRRRWSKSKEKASGRSWETRESRESVLGGRLGNPQEKPRGDSVGERYITTTLLLSPRIF